ncbi:helix-turn-helix domain-containing protein [Labilibacter marinus]|uniref:helix-turn-helix domain-containing protein n=1 Tax=Labilibacter marinus TaxID=1477105 RepID=UPI000836E959|nr:helix-turn-helix domain-containing protein [Labilibacter marinus]
MQPDKQTVLEQLNRILNDASFSRSKVNGRLLNFLVNASLNNEEIKEVIIGNELFGSGYDPIKSDNKVRVYVYNLRKKLNEYYAKNAHDEIIFAIDKGQYQVSFTKKEDQHTSKKTVQKKYAKLVFLITAVIIASLVLIFTLEKKEENLFWNQSLQNNKPTTVLFGDFFTFQGPTVINRMGAIRDYSINSTEDLDLYLKQHPHLKDTLTPSKNPYMGGYVPYCTKEISYLFFKNNHPFNVNLVSGWDETYMQTNNLVYFGAGKCMGILEKVLTDIYPQYSFAPQMVSRLDTLSGKVINYMDVVSFSDKIIDYTVVAKATMPSGNQMSFFLSDQDCGAISALQYFTQNNSVTSFYKRHNLQEDDDFIALFKVTGWLRKSYDMEFILLDKK